MLISIPNEGGILLFAPFFLVFFSFFFFPFLCLAQFLVTTERIVQKLGDTRDVDVKFYKRTQLLLAGSF